MAHSAVMGGVVRMIQADGIRASNERNGLSWPCFTPLLSSSIHQRAARWDLCLPRLPFESEGGLSYSFDSRSIATKHGHAVDDVEQ